MNRNDKDDMRTVADMSNLEHRGILSQWLGILDPNVREKYVPDRNMEGEGEEWSKEDRRALIIYTMKYALGIGLVFVVALGLAVFLMTKFWH